MIVALTFAILLGGGVATGKNQTDDATADSMVPYILAENPGMSGVEVIRRSKEMMKGHKWNTFVLDISFIGWLLLAVITADIAGVLWTNPYMEATDAELYKAIK